MAHIIPSKNELKLKQLKHIGHNYLFSTRPLKASRISFATSRALLLYLILSILILALYLKDPFVHELLEVIAGSLGLESNGF